MVRQPGRRCADALWLLLLASLGAGYGLARPAPVRAQVSPGDTAAASRVPVAPPVDTTAPPASYLTWGLETQITQATFLDGGRITGEVGYLRGLGRARAWRPQIAAALTLFSSNTFVGGLGLGPRVSFSRTLPLTFFAGPAGRQLVLGAEGLVDGVWRFGGEPSRARGTRLEPALRGNLGYRIHLPGIRSYGLFQLAVEGREHTAGPVLYLHLGVESPGGPGTH